jgi:hypothetical protein
MVKKAHGPETYTHGRLTNVISNTNTLRRFLYDAYRASVYRILKKNCSMVCQVGYGKDSANKALRGSLTGIISTAGLRVVRVYLGLILARIYTSPNGHQADKVFVSGFSHKVETPILRGQGSHSESD